MAITPALLDVLSEARDSKFLGPGPLQVHIDNALGFFKVLGDIGFEGSSGTRIVDLGSGGGVPALILAELLPTTLLRLVERGTNRARFLEGAVVHLDLQDRIEVVTGNVEEVAREPHMEQWADAVTARAFAPPAATAECACRLLRHGGVLVVSEPPPDQKARLRWPIAGLGPTGLAPTETVRHGQHSFQLLVMTGPVEERLPRSPSATRRRPLF